MAFETSRILTHKPAAQQPDPKMTSSMLSSKKWLFANIRRQQLSTELHRNSTEISTIKKHLGVLAAATMTAFHLNPLLHIKFYYCSMFYCGTKVIFRHMIGNPSLPLGFLIISQTDTPGALLFFRTKHRLSISTTPRIR